MTENCTETETQECTEEPCCGQNLEGCTETVTTKEETPAVDAGIPIDEYLSMTAKQINEMVKALPQETENRELIYKFINLVNTYTKVVDYQRDLITDFGTKLKNISDVLNAKAN